MEARPTLKDVARAAGVAKATASLALRNHPKISAATAARVKAVAEKIRYRPDPAISRIASYRWQSRQHPSDATIAFISTAHPDLHLEIGPEVRAAACRRGEQLGYHVEHFPAENHGRPEQLARILYHRGIRGVLIGQIFNETFVQRFPWQDFASVGANVGYYPPPTSLVVPDFLHTTVRVWREAMRAGYRRIGVALLEEFQAVDLCDKLSAALFCQTRLEPASQVIPIRHFPIADRTEFQAWLRQYRPEVVIGFNNAVYWWLQEANYRVPEDIGYISLMLEHACKPNEPISGMDPDLDSIGRIALEQLDILLRTHQVGIPEPPVLVQVPGTWREGATLRRSEVDLNGNSPGDTLSNAAPDGKTNAG